MDNRFKPVIRGFEHVKRFWDSGRDSIIAQALPGEFYVSKSEELSSLLIKLINSFENNIYGSRRYDIRMHDPLDFEELNRL